MQRQSQPSTGDTTATVEASSHPARPRGRYLALLSLTALGVVYGDIGTSPLYALRECFHGPHAVEATQANVIGALSMIFWSLVLIISIKYLVFILRADNQGEGGILALTALVTPVRAEAQGGRRFLILLGLFGAALLYGDGIITPAISVLSAVEGLEVATPFFEPYIIPITVLILASLFMLQRRGTGGVGLMFGPITLLWALVLALLGLLHILREPGVLAAVNPVHSLEFFLRNQWRAFLVLGSVFLVVTGGEALYADMGHFGTRPIRVAWFFVMLPALLLNYFGQGALLIGSPSAARNPFYQMAPGWALYPIVILATMATVIASQAVISGAFSLTRQAVLLGYSPRLRIEHTSPHQIGQIYIPVINWALMLTCIGLVIGFRSSSNLAAAYGVAVTTTMVITTLLFYVVIRRRWKWNWAVAVLLCGILLIVEVSFFGANIIKIADGGWFPILIAALAFTLMSTWKTGRRILSNRLEAASIPIEKFLEDIQKQPLARIPGTAVFMYGKREGTPPTLLRNIKHNKVLHEQNIILNVQTDETPHVAEEDRVEVEEIGQGFFRIVLHYGFMEDPDIPEALSSIDVPGLSLSLEKTSFFLSRERLFATPRPGMAIWREHIFIWLSRNARGATSFFRIPPGRVVELGEQIEL
ncbi:MAG: potassium transporter Kup [Acidobacteriota bacterium]